MKKFKVIALVYTVNYENQYCPTCNKHEFEVKAHDENHALYKAARRFDFFGVHKIFVL